MKSLQLLVLFCLMICIAAAQTKHKSDKQHIIELMNKNTLTEDDIKFISSIRDELRIETKAVANGNLKINSNDERENEEFAEHFNHWFEMVMQKHLNNTNTNKSSLVWNEYFNYLSKNGTNIMSAHGNWINVGCNQINHGSLQGGGAAMGRMHCVRIDPVNSNTVYAGSPGGGLWKSTNGGDSWYSLTDALPRIGVADVAINPLNNNVVYIVTGADAFCPSIGVLKSVNGGFTWQKTGLVFNDATWTTGRRIIINPSNPDIIYAVFSSGIYKSADAGITWTKSLANDFIYDIKLKPGSSDTVYASGRNKFYRSTTNGTTWDSTTIGINSEKLLIATTIANPNYIYLMQGFGQKARIFRSINSGSTFPLIADTPNVIKGIPAATAGNMAIEVSPTNANTIFFGALDIYKSTTGGSAVSQIASGAYPPQVGSYVHVDLHDFDYSNGVLFAASDGGIYKSTDDGVTWIEKVLNLSTEWIVKFGYTPSFSPWVLFGAYDNGITLFNGTSTCTPLFPGDGDACVIDYTNSNILYGITNGLVIKSINGGPWYSILRSDNYPSLPSGIHPIKLHPTNNNILFGGGKDMYKITNPDTLSSWVKLNADSTYFHESFDICASNPNIIYACQRPNAGATTAGRVERYNGSTWTNIKSNLPTTWDYNNYPNDIVADPKKQNHAWLTFSGYTAGTKVFETTTGGTTWINRSGTLPNIQATCIAFGSVIKNEVYLGTEIGVFYRDNTLTDWVPFNNGMPRVSISDIEVDTANNLVIASTVGRGLFQSDLYSSCPVSYNFTGVTNYQFGKQFYEASNTIISDRTFNNGLGDQITYKAGDYVRFDPGFFMTAGGELNALIGPCTGYPPAIVNLSGNLEGDAELRANVIDRQHTFTAKIAPAAIEINPNPVSDSYSISFTCANEEAIEIAVIDELGITVQTLIQNESFDIGKHEFTVSSANLKSGIYLLRLKQGNNQCSKRMIKL